MSKTTGDRIPDVTLLVMQDGNPVEVNSLALFGTNKVVVFAMPGAFTSTCSRTHLPSVVANAEALRAKGADTVAVLAVNDPFTMKAWGETADAAAHGVLMVADPQAAWAQEVGLTFSNPARGLINRSSRYAMVIEDGVILRHEIEEPGPVCTLSSGEAVLDLL